VGEWGRPRWVGQGGGGGAVDQLAARAPARPGHAPVSPDRAPASRGGRGGLAGGGGGGTVDHLAAWRRLSLPFLLSLPVLVVRTEQDKVLRDG